SRTALEDVELDGNLIKKGDIVVNSIGAANRDPAVYPDPNRLDLTRENVRPLSFGGGIHTCLGAQLARMETEIALSTLLRRLPNLQLHDLDQPNWMQSFIWRGLRSLRATW
ncbi:MAG: cytochrome P450, partial [Sulfurifustaceae bacterium]